MVRRREVLVLTPGPEKAGCKSVNGCYYVCVPGALGLICTVTACVDMYLYRILKESLPILAATV